MHSIRELYKIGPGPSSSHTMGPAKATTEFLSRGNFDELVVTLYGSLSLTGKGHLTDKIIIDTSTVKTRVEFNLLTKKPHVNTMVFEGYLNGVLQETMEVYSVGGGSIRIKGEEKETSEKIYQMHSFIEIKDFCKRHKKRIYEYVLRAEGPSIYKYMNEIYDVMMESIDDGLNKTGLLPGTLEVKRKANQIYSNSLNNRNKCLAYAYAVAEENACGHLVVTSPTCGAAGVLPAVVRYSEEELEISKETVLNGLLTAGLFGNLVKFNASISGAECGCQAEIGTATVMAAAYLSEVLGKDLNEMESSAEISLEHSLGLTCDPVSGYVQIPCIERNSLAALRAIDAVGLACLTNGMNNKISFDLCVLTMLETGKDLNEGYRETARSGLAKHFNW